MGKSETDRFQTEGSTLVKYRGSDPRVTVPQGITKIARYAFLGCRGLRQATLPDSVTQIGANAFQACRQLETVELPAGLKELGGAVFSSCTQLKQLQLPPELKVIPMHMCNDCRNLERIDFPDGLELIGWNAFHGCSALKSLALPQHLGWIGEGAFAQCTALTRLDLPDEVSRIDRGAFSGCQKLRRIKLPAQLRAVQAETFSGCALAWVELPESVSAVDFTAFRDCHRLEMIVINSRHINIANYGTGDPATMPTDAPVFFRVPRVLLPNMQRNMLRGYARMRLLGKTEPIHDQIYLNHIRKEIKSVCLIALSDSELLQMLMKEQLIPLELAKALIDQCHRKDRREQVALLLDYCNQNNDTQPAFDPTKVFVLDSGE